MRASGALAKAWGGDVAQGQPRHRQGPPGEAGLGVVAGSGVGPCPFRHPQLARLQNSRTTPANGSPGSDCTPSRLFERAELMLHEHSVSLPSLAELCQAIPVTNRANCRWGRAWPPTSPARLSNPRAANNLDAQIRDPNSRIKTVNSSWAGDLAPLAAQRPSEGGDKARNDSVPPVHVDSVLITGEAGEAFVCPESLAHGIRTTQETAGDGGQHLGTIGIFSRIAHERCAATELVSQRSMHSGCSGGRALAGPRPQCPHRSRGQAIPAVLAGHCRALQAPVAARAALGHESEEP